jgi:hypothetical protein
MHFLCCCLTVFLTLLAMHTRADCSLCSPLVNNCSAGGITYTQCYSRQNSIYRVTNNINTACLPANPSDPKTYNGYAVPNASTYSCCHNYSATACPSDCAYGCPTPGAVNCMLGKYSIAMYNQAGALTGIVYCALIATNAYSPQRGNLFANCLNTTYGGPYPASAYTPVGKKRRLIGCGALTAAPTGPPVCTSLLYNFQNDYTQLLACNCTANADGSLGCVNANQTCVTQLRQSYPGYPLGCAYFPPSSNGISC